jgi:hypothetical protein
MLYKIDPHRIHAMMGWMGGGGKTYVRCNQGILTEGEVSVW